MQNFKCKVMTPQGQIAKLNLEAEDKVSCTKKLKKNGMIPISITPSFNFKKKNKNATATIYSKKKKKNIFSKMNSTIKISNKVSLEELKEFTTDFYILIESEFTTKDALTTIINKSKNTYFKECLTDILKNLENGIYIYKTMKEYSDIFPLIYINLIKTGELTNTINEALKYASNYLEDEQKIKNKIQNVLIPNIAVFIGILVMLILAVIIVIPNIQNIFSSYGSTINIPKLILYMSSFIKKCIKYWYIIFITFGIAIILFFKYISESEGKYKFDKFIFCNPLFGKLLFLLSFSRIIKSIFLNIQNKMRIQDALEISKNVTKNTYMSNIIEKAINNVYVGKPWLECFEEEHNLNSIILELLKKGMKTKSIENIEKAIKYLDSEIENEIERVLKILPEISYAIVGIALLLFVITILIPCINIYLGGFIFF